MADNTTIATNNVVLYKLNLNRKPEAQELPVISVKQYDTGRGLRMYLFEGEKSYKTDNSTFHLRIRKPDGTVWMDECKIIEDSSHDGTTVYVRLDGQALMSAGRAYADLLEMKGGKPVVSLPPEPTTEENNTEPWSEEDGDETNIYYDVSTIPFIIVIIPSPNTKPDKQFSSDAFPYLLRYLHKARRAENVLENFDAEVHFVAQESPSVDVVPSDTSTILKFYLPIVGKPFVSQPSSQGEGGGTLVWPNASGGCDCELAATSNDDRLILDITHGE